MRFLLKNPEIALGLASAGFSLPKYPPNILNQSRKHIMLVHTVYFWLKSGLSEEDRQQFQDGVESLATIESAEQVLVGTPAETNKRPVVDDTYDCALTVILQDIPAHDLYQDDPIHHKFIADCNHLWERVQIYDAD